MESTATSRELNPGNAFLFVFVQLEAGLDD